MAIPDNACESFKSFLVRASSAVWIDMFLLCLFCLLYPSLRLACTLLDNDEPMQYGGAAEAETVELSATDIVVPTVGWIVVFPTEETVAQETSASSSGGLVMGLVDDNGLWVWWVWLIYALLVACCLVPLCCCLCRR